MSGEEYLMTQEELNEAMIGIIYARVSTRQQEKDGTSLDTQVEKCLELAERNGIHVPAENILKEQGSGADPMRPLFLVFNEAIEKRKVNAAILYDTDRYAREPLYIEILAEICELAGVELYILKGTSGIGGSSPRMWCGRLSTFLFYQAAVGCVSCTSGSASL